MKNCKIIYCFKSKKNWIAIKMQKKIYDIKKPILILIFWNNNWKISFSPKSMIEHAISIIIPIIVKTNPIIKQIKNGEKYLCFIYFSATKKNIDCKSGNISIWINNI